MNILFTPNQDKVFLYMLAVGLILGLIYDLFKAKRMLLGCCGVILFVDDILFCFIGFVVFISSCFMFNYGIIRWYQFFAIALGFILFRLTLSRPLLLLISMLAKLLSPVKVIIIGFILLVNRFKLCIFRNRHKNRILSFIYNYREVKK